MEGDVSILNDVFRGAALSAFVPAHVLRFQDMATMRYAQGKKNNADSFAVPDTA
jgi:hypothetical protein